MNRVKVKIKDLLSAPPIVHGKYGYIIDCVETKYGHQYIIDVKVKGKSMRLCLFFDEFEVQ